MGAPFDPAPSHGPRRGAAAPAGRDRSRRWFVAAAVLGAATAAWIPAAQAPSTDALRGTPSYASMAAALAGLYPGSAAHAHRIVAAVHAEADRHRLDPCLVMGVIARESSFRPGARSGRDVGLMQLNLDWHRELVARSGGADGLLDPQRNVRAGTELLAHYRRLAGDDAGALRRYHGLSKRNDYVQRVQASARGLQAAGACLGDGDTRVVRR